MIESKIYIGLNDETANTQLFENEQYTGCCAMCVMHTKSRFLSACRRADISVKAVTMRRKLMPVDVNKALVRDIAEDVCSFIRSRF